jgi:hypothetical protein
MVALRSFSIAFVKICLVWRCFNNTPNFSPLSGIVPRTVKTHSNALRQFLAAFPERSPETITIPEIEAFINQVYQSTSYSLERLTFFFRKSIAVKSLLTIPIPTDRKTKIPIVLSKEEVKGILDASKTSNTDVCLWGCIAADCASASVSTSKSAIASPQLCDASARKWN